MSQFQSGGNKEKEPLPVAASGFWGFLQLPFDFFGKVLTAIKGDLRLAILWGFGVLLLVVLIATFFLARGLSPLEQFGVAVLIVLVIAFLFVYTLHTGTSKTFTLNIPETFKEAIRRRLRPGTGGVIVPVRENLQGTPFHLFEKNQFLDLPHNIKAVKAAVVQQAIATKYQWENYTFCAAIFRNVNPEKNYMIWKGQLSTDMNDNTRQAGVVVFADEVRDEIRFD